MFRWIFVLSCLSQHAMASTSEFQIRTENTISFGSAAEKNLGLSSLDVGEAVEMGWNRGNRDWGFGFEFTNRQTQIDKASSKNAAIKSGDLSYSVVSFPIYFSAYIPFKTEWFRPGIELGASYLLVNKTAMEQDVAFFLSPKIKFVVTPHLDLFVNGRVLIPMGSTGSTGATSFIDNARFGFGPGVAWTF